MPRSLTDKLSIQQIEAMRNRSINAEKQKHYVLSHPNKLRQYMYENDNNARDAILKSICLTFGITLIVALPLLSLPKKFQIVEYIISIFAEINMLYFTLASVFLLFSYFNPDILPKTPYAKAVKYVDKILNPMKNDLDKCGQYDNAHRNFIFAYIYDKDALEILIETTDKYTWYIENIQKDALNKEGRSDTCRLTIKISKHLFDEMIIPYFNDKLNMN